MADAERPDPDALLERVQREEAQSRRGMLRIFFVERAVPPIKPIEQPAPIALPDGAASRLR